MIARTRIRLPYEVPAAQGSEQTPRKTKWGSWEVVIHPLHQGEDEDPKHRYLGRPRTPDQLNRLVARRTIELPASGVTLNGQSVVQCNVLTLEFLDVEYDRLMAGLPKGVVPNLAAGVPSVFTVFELANRFLSALRDVTGLSMLREIDPTREVWVVEYLDDSRQPLPVETGKFRSRQSHMGPLPWGAVFKRSFESALDILDRPDSAPWDQLMLEAVDELPATGPALVLAYAAFEQIVNAVVSYNVPATFSSKQRKAILSNKQTSPLYRADVVLTQLVGQSLRSQTEGWGAAEELARLRNKYLHYGIAPTFTAQPAWFAAGQLLRRTSEGMLWLETFLPAATRRDRAVKGVDVKYELPHPSSPVFGSLGGMVIYLPNDPEPAVVDP